MVDVYWEDEEYKQVMKSYSEYRILCESLNEFDPKNREYFNKRDNYLRQSHDIMVKYNSR